ncbi:MAG: hypothetical protein V7709_20640, partial [Halioglobus sp.]
TKGLGDGALQGLENTLPVSPSNDNAVRVLGTCYVKDKKPTVWEVPKGSKNYIVSDGTPLSPSFPNASYASSDCYFLQFFNVLEDGSIQSIATYPQPTTGVVVADSCWMSMDVSGQFTIN